MQDGVSREQGREAGEWLRKRFAGEAEPELSITWNVTEAPGSAEAHLRLLEMLFAPELGDKAA